MTVEIQIRKRELVGENNIVKEMITEQWINFTRDLAKNGNFYRDFENQTRKRLKKYNAILHVHLGIVEFNTEQDAVLWLLKYS